MLKVNVFFSPTQFGKCSCHSNLLTTPFLLFPLPKSFPLSCDLTQGRSTYNTVPRGDPHEKRRHPWVYKARRWVSERHQYLFNFLFIQSLGNFIKIPKKFFALFFKFLLGRNIFVEWKCSRYVYFSRDHVLNLIFFPSTCCVIECVYSVLRLWEIT